MSLWHGQASNISVLLVKTTGQHNANGQRRVMEMVMEMEMEIGRWGPQMEKCRLKSQTPS